MAHGSVGATSKLSEKLPIAAKAAMEYPMKIVCLPEILPANRDDIHEPAISAMEMGKKRNMNCVSLRWRCFMRKTGAPSM